MSTEVKRRGRPKKPTNPAEQAKYEEKKKASQEIGESIEFFKFKIANAKQKVAKLAAQIKKIENGEIKALEQKMAEAKKKASEIKKA
jgi:hypothetical protein